MMIEIYIDTGDSMRLIARISSAQLGGYLAALPKQYRDHVYELVERVNSAYFKKL